MAGLDLNAVQGQGTPITVTLTGSIGVLQVRESVRTEWAMAIGAAGLTPDDFQLSFDLFSTHYNAVVICRTTAQIVTAFQVLWIVQHACPAAVDSATVTAIGNPGDVVTPKSSSFLDPVVEALARALGLDVKSVGSSITAALQLAVVIALVLGAFWLYHLTV